jgi:microcin C transport system permease protein
VDAKTLPKNIDDRIEPGIPEELKPDVEPAGPMGLNAPARGFEFSPINARRWQNFKTNKRGFWSLWIFLILFVVSLLAEFIANDRPLFIHYDGKNFFPIFITYPDTDFGDVLGTAADYRDPYLQKYLNDHHAIEIWAPIRFSYSTINDRPPSAFPSKPTWLLNKADWNTTGSAPTTRAATCWRG